MYGYKTYGGFGRGLPPAVKALLIANVIMFVVPILLPIISWNRTFGLVPYYVTHYFMIWQLFTYMFLHGGFAHILFNMFALWMFGAELEYNWGSRDFLKFYLICGVGGGVLVWLTSFFGFSSPTIATIGASGAIWGVLVAFGLMWPDRMIFLFGILPIKALHFVIIFGGLELINGLGRSQGGIAYFAHVGGGLTGFIYLKYGWRMMVHIESWLKRATAGSTAKKHGFTVHDGGRSTPSGSGPGQQEAPHPDHDDEVDRILDKIAREGMDSLTGRERKILDNASKRKK